MANLRQASKMGATAMRVSQGKATSARAKSVASKAAKTVKAGDKQEDFKSLISPNRKTKAGEAVQKGAVKAYNKNLKKK